MKKTSLTILVVLLFFYPIKNLFAQQNDYSVSGFITDEITGEELFGTNILIYKSPLDLDAPPVTGTASNRYGFYAVPSLESGIYIFIYKHLGYKTVLKEINLSGDSVYRKHSIGMFAEDIKLEEVLVEGKKIEKDVSSLIDISPDILSKLPSITGEIDLLKSLEMLPGVNKASEISSGLYVRGGSPDQTLTLLDGVIVYNPAHLGNIASTFNTIALRDIKLIKGAFPAEYGGRLSSILDIKLRSGTKEKEKAILGLGLINSYAFLEGPLGELGTYMVSGRGMYYDYLQKKFISSTSVPRVNFRDLNAKVTFNLSPSNIVSVSGLYSKDNVYNPLKEELDYNIEWTNSFISVNWLHISSKSIFINSLINFVNYKFKSIIGMNPEKITSSSYFASSNLKDFSALENVELRWSEGNTLKSGVEITYHSYDVLYSDAYNALLEKDPFAGNNFNSIEGALYFQNESKIGSILGTNLGVRFYYFSSSKYYNVEPRLSLTYYLSENTLVKGAFAVAHQFLHLINKNNISLPTDLWYPSTKQLSPSKSTEYVFGVDNYFFNEEYLLTVEGYYRNMKNLYEFKNNAILDPYDQSLEKQFTKGEGESYGVELFINKRKGNLSGWIGYTLSWTKRKFNELNAGKIFYPKYDRRNDVSVVLTYKFSSSFNVGLTWVYATGQRYTLPTGQYIFHQIRLNQIEEIFLNQPSLNEYEFPAYHKLDLNISYSFNWLSSKMGVYLNILNLYNRQNPFAQYITEVDNPDGSKKLVVKRIMLFPIIPTVGFRVEF